MDFSYKYMRMDDALDFTLYLKNEHQYGPWEMGLGQLNYLRLLFYDTPLKHCFDVSFCCFGKTIGT